jgi:hypothetical protein
MWEATLDDGTIANAERCRFSEIRGRVKSLRFLYAGIVHKLPDNQQEYFCASTASAPLGGGEATVESRWIGCRTKDGRLIRLRFSATRNMVSVETD